MIGDTSTTKTVVCACREGVEIAGGGGGNLVLMLRCLPDDNVLLHAFGTQVFASVLIEDASLGGLARIGKQC